MTRRWIILALSIPFILVLSWFTLVENWQGVDNWTNSGWLLLMSVIIYALLALPALSVILLLQRNRLAERQNQLLVEQIAVVRARSHVQEFIEFIPKGLCKRLGSSPLVIHRVFFPSAAQGDVGINQDLLQFLHLGLAELCQAAKVINELSIPEDENEQTIKNNRLCFLVEQSVTWMYFIADKIHGDPPDCKEIYFVHDALADYYDLMSYLIDFSYQASPTYDISTVYHLFTDQQCQEWFKRHTDLLTHCCDIGAQQNPMKARFIEGI